MGESGIVAENKVLCVSSSRFMMPNTESLRQYPLVKYPSAYAYEM
jgi:hypothetical protein